MESELINAIKLNTEVLFTNVNIMLQTCNLDFILCDMPIWKHVYHMLHSCDQWYINPNEYKEPDFHEPNLNSLDIKSEKRSQEMNYYDILIALRRKLWTI